MKRKQVLVSMLGATMILGSSMQAFAATGTAENTTGTEITGNGDVSYIDTTVYSVTLPTTNSTKLTIDPQGLLGLGAGETATPEELADYAGKITCSATPIVTNLSSEPMKITAKLSLTGSGATAVTAAANVEDQTTKKENVLLYAIPSSVDTMDAEANYTASETGIVLTTTEASVNFILPAAEYNFKKDEAGTTTTYELVEGEKGHGTGLSFEGLVNKYADWSAYTGSSATKQIGMKAVFTFTNTIADGEAADTTDGAPYAMMPYSGTKVAVEPKNTAPVLNNGTDTVTYSKASGGNIVIPVKLGAGELGADAITDVALQFTDDTYHSVNGLWGFATTFKDSFTITNSSITIDSGYLEYVSVGDHNLIVVFDGDDSATQTVKISVAE